MPYDDSSSEDSALEITESLADKLNSLIPDNDFYCTGTIDSLPFITVGGTEVCKFPCVGSAAKELIALCEETPFGRGEETLYDKDVRNGWQLTRDKFSVGYGKWRELEQDSDRSQVLEAVRGSLAENSGRISAEVDKLLVYETGCHFKKHLDTQRRENHFGTLLVFLPSVYEGGDLVVRHKGQERRFNFSMDKTKSMQCHYVAMFTDCEHEVEVVTSGYRVNLQYSLFFEGRQQPSPPDSDVTAKCEQFIDDVFDSISSKYKNIGYMCEHQYTSKSLAPMFLKGKDAYLFHTLSHIGKYRVRLVPIHLSAVAYPCSYGDYYAIEEAIKYGNMPYYIGVCAAIVEST